MMNSPAPDRAAAHKSRSRWRAPRRAGGAGPPSPAGGVKVGEVMPNTMASKRVRGLYFAGEVLDVDAYTGGFNLQIAWATGYLAGLSAAESEEMT